MLSVLNGPWLLVSVLAFGIGSNFCERFAPASVVNAEQQLVFFGIVAGRLGKSDAVLRYLGEAHAEAIRLHFFIALAVFAGRLGADARQNAALGIAGNDVRGDGRLQHAEVMTVVKHSGLHTVPFLVVGVAWIRGRHGSRRPRRPSGRLRKSHR